MTIIQRGEKWLNMHVPYDHNSIMHYGSNYFLKSEAAQKGEFTMLKKPEMTPIFPNSPRMTTLDMQQLAVMYKYWCPNLQMDQCENGENILKNRLCDGVYDCADGSDEKGCGNYDCPRVIEFSSSIKFKDRSDNSN